MRERILCFPSSFPQNINVYCLFNQLAFEQSQPGFGSVCPGRDSGSKARCRVNRPINTEASPLWRRISLFRSECRGIKSESKSGKRDRFSDTDLQLQHLLRSKELDRADRAIVASKGGRVSLCSRWTRKLHGDHEPREFTHARFSHSYFAEVCLCNGWQVYR